MSQQIRHSVCGRPAPGVDVVVDPIKTEGFVQVCRFDRDIPTTVFAEVGGSLFLHDGDVSCKRFLLESGY